jgi:hypothetical protein
MLDNYADISLAPMTVEPRETFHTLHEKLVEYIHEHPGYLTQILREGSEAETYESSYKTTITNDTILHAFPYFKKSKKPINMSFRNRGARHNFTKKTYQ